MKLTTANSFSRAAGNSFQNRRKRVIDAPSQNQKAAGVHGFLRLNLRMRETELAG
jgi:hypothetical protein